MIKVEQWVLSIIWQALEVIREGFKMAFFFFWETQKFLFPLAISIIATLFSIAVFIIIIGFIVDVAISLFGLFS